MENTEESKTTCFSAAFTATIAVISARAGVGIVERVSLRTVSEFCASRRPAWEESL